MSDLLTKLKPGVPRRVRLFLAAAAWTAVGLALLIAGARWCLVSEPPMHLALIAAAIAVGLAKAFFILRPAAHRVTRRIHAGGDDRCIGGFFSWQTWIFVTIMMTAGALLRRSDLARPVIGFVYVAVGVALVVASWLPWQAWFRDLSPPPAGGNAEST